MAKRRRGRGVLKVVGVLAVGWLVVDKVVAIAEPDVTVGHWRSAAAQAAYGAAYRAIMADLPEPTRTLDVQTEHGSIRVLEWIGSESGPPVVLVPGHSSGAPMWADNLPSWIGERTVYALDPLGDAGFSVQRLPLVRFDEQAQWISETLRALEVDRAHVLGHSFGAATAAMFAVAHPEQVASLALLEPVLVVEALPVSAFFWAAVTQLPVPQSVKDRALAEIGGVTVAEVQERTPMAVMIDAAVQGYAAAVPLPRKLTDGEWRALEMPLRVDIAGAQSMSGGEAAAERVRTLRPEATVTVWPNATHSLPMHEHAALGPRLLDFWRANS